MCIIVWVPQSVNSLKETIHWLILILLQNSTGSIEVNTTSNNEKSVQATLNLVNATKISVTAQIYGSSVTIGSLAMNSGSNSQAKPKTFTVVYGHNNTQTRNRRIHLGQRQAGDRLLEFQHKNVTLPVNIFKKFAEDDFVYYGKQQFITSIQFSFDVSETQRVPNLYLIQLFRF